MTGLRGISYGMFKVVFPNFALHVAHPMSFNLLCFFELVKQNCGEVVGVNAKFSGDSGQ